MNEFDDYYEIYLNFLLRKKNGIENLRFLSPLEKIEKLVQLQEQTYQMFVIREQNGGKPIPERWQKWYQARYKLSV